LVLNDICAASINGDVHLLLVLHMTETVADRYGITHD